MNLSTIPQTTFVMVDGLIMLVIILIFMWLTKFSLNQFLATLNTINSQVWAAIILWTVIMTALLFHRAGIAVDIAAGVVGAAVNMFNSLIKPAAPGSQHLEVDTTPPVPPTPPTPMPTLTITPAIVPPKEQE